MARLPRIGAPRSDEDDFHDSYLLDLRYDPVAASLAVVLSTEDRQGRHQGWRIELSGVLHLEMETVGTGADPHDGHPPIYSVYAHDESPALGRWRTRMEMLGEDPGTLQHIVFASSFLCGWGEHRELDGIHVICRSARVGPAGAEYASVMAAGARIPGSR